MKNWVFSDKIFFQPFVDPVPIYCLVIALSDGVKLTRPNKKRHVYFDRKAITRFPVRGYALIRNINSRSNETWAYVDHAPIKLIGNDCNLHPNGIAARDIDRKIGMEVGATESLELAETGLNSVRLELRMNLRVSKIYISRSRPNGFSREFFESEVSGKFSGSNIANWLMPHWHFGNNYGQIFMFLVLLEILFFRKLDIFIFFSF